MRNMMNRILFRIEQLSLQRRLMIMYVLIMLLPSIFISVYIFNGLYGNYLSDAERKNEHTLELERMNIVNNIASMERVVQLAKRDHEVLDYLSRTSEPTVGELIEIDNETVTNLVRIQFSNPNIEHIHIFTKDDVLYELWPVFFHERRIRKEPWHQKVLANGEQEYWVIHPEDREIIRRLGSEETVKKPKISLVRSIYYPQNNYVGMIQADMLLEKFFPGAFNPLQDEQSQMAVIDRDGHLYLPSNAKMPADTGLTKEAIMEQLGRQEPAEAIHSFKFDYGGVPFLASALFIERIDAYLLQIVSLEPVYRDLNNTRNTIIAANILLIVLLSVVTHFINALILKKLHILSDSMKKVRKGEFDFELSVRGGGEVGELAHHFRKMLGKINGLIAEAVNKQAASKEAELTSLKNQIDSHFLYNTLENIKMLAEMENQPVISDALTSLGGLMRYNLRWTSEYVRLRDELNHIHNYIAIMNMRFEEKAVIHADIEPAYLDQELLKMSLQPIVENAVKHGMKNEELEISIVARVDGGTMRIEITDNGKGMPEEAVRRINDRISAFTESGELGQEVIPLTAMDESASASSGGSGIGLRNVQQRIQMFFGAEYGLLVESQEGSYTRVTMRIPYFIMTGRMS
ncbi:sensor histidine kinase [Paenibacillus tarimensis]